MVFGVPAQKVAIQKLEFMQTRGGYPSFASFTILCVLFLDLNVWVPVNNVRIWRLRCKVVMKREMWKRNGRYFSVQFAEIY